MTLATLWPAMPVETEVQLIAQLGAIAVAVVTAIGLILVAIVNRTRLGRGHHMTWDQYQNLFEDYGPVAITIIVLLLFFGVIHKSWPLISNFVSVVNALVQLPTVIATVEDIRKEVKPNGGGSMRDVVNSTARKVDSLELRFDEHLGKRPSQVDQRPDSVPSVPRAPRKPRTRKPPTD